MFRGTNVLVVAAIAVTALSACGSKDGAGANDAGPKVATVASAPVGKPSASAAAQRPRERLDTTSDEFLAMLGPYNKCMKEQGIVGGTQGAKENAAKIRPANSAEQAKLDAANRICEPQFYPLPPWERDPANPKAKDFALGVVRCLKAKGIKFVAVDKDGLGVALGGEKNDARSIRLGMQYMPECERQVAASMK